MAAKFIASIDEAAASLVTGNNWYYSLHTADPGLTGANEATVIGRVEVLAASGWNAFADDVPTGGRYKANSATVGFGNASGAQTFTHIGIWDAATSGNFKGGGPLVSPVTSSSGQPVSIPPGNLVIVGAGS